MEGKMDCRKILAEYVLLGILIFGQVVCYPNGAPESTCSSMMPSHGATANTSPAPYTITTSKSTYKPSEEITITLQANSGMNFKGFLIQPREYNSLNEPNTVGNITGDYTRNPCIGLASLTHANSTLKTRVNLTWKAPAVAVENVVFLATFVQTKTTYWLYVKSRELIPELSVPVKSSSGGRSGVFTTGSSGNDSRVTTYSSGGAEVTRAYIGGVSTMSYGTSLTCSLIWFLLLV